MLDIKSALRNNVTAITGALACGIYAAAKMGLGWSLAAIPAFVFILGMEQLYKSLPPKIKPFAGLISLVAFFIITLLVINFLAAIMKSQSLQQAEAHAGSTLPLQSELTLTAAKSMPEIARESDPETANRVYGMFLSELGKRTSATENFDQITWMKGMTECIGTDQQQGTLSPQEMEKIASCADQRMKERLQKAP